MACFEDSGIPDSGLGDLFSLLILFSSPSLHLALLIIYVFGVIIYLTFRSTLAVTFMRQRACVVVTSGIHCPAQDLEHSKSSTYSC